MTEWISTSTAQLIEDGKLEIGDGYRAKNAEFGEHGIPFLRISNLGEGQLLLDGADLFPEDNLDKVTGKVSRPKDCVIATKATIGRLGYLDESSPTVLYSPQVSYWRVLDESVLEPRFVRCWLTGKEFEAQAFQTKSSTAMADYINLRDQRRMLMTLPPIQTQRKIAAVVAAYDELIENNLRRIEILEGMAQAIYREWFVNFRYPGHEHDELVGSPVGPIPGGWEVTQLGELADVNAVSIRKGSAPAEIDYIDISSVSPRSVDAVKTMPFEEAPSRARRVVRPGDVVWSTVRPNRRSFALVLHPQENTIASTGFAVLTPTAVPCSYLYEAVGTHEFAAYLTNHAKGAAYPAVAAEDFEKASMIRPPPRLLDAFDDRTRPMLELVHVLATMNQDLRSARDLLLPKLVSGEIDVSGLDIDTAWLAA